MMTVYNNNIEKPKKTEYDIHFQPYIDLVEDGNFFEKFIENKKSVINFFEQIPGDKYNYKYAENKWTVKEVLLHMIDTERVFAYRALACARGDNSPLPYMDEEQYGKNADVTYRTMNSLIAEFEKVRDSNTVLFQYMTEQESKFQGNIGGEHGITARALGYITLGHTIHHINIIKERYLKII